MGGSDEMNKKMAGSQNSNAPEGPRRNAVVSESQPFVGQRNGS